MDLPESLEGSPATESRWLGPCLSRGRMWEQWVKRRQAVTWEKWLGVAEAPPWCRVGGKEPAVCLPVWLAPCPLSSGEARAEAFGLLCPLPGAPFPRDPQAHPSSFRSHLSVAQLPCHSLLFPALRLFIALTLVCPSAQSPSPPTRAGAPPGRYSFTLVFPVLRAALSDTSCICNFKFC